MTPKVLKTAAEHEAALAHLASLMDAAAGSPEEAELELWSVLVEKYEEEHFPIGRPDPVSAIEFRMAQEGLTRADLLRFIPSKSKVSEVLARKRPLSLAMIRALHAGLGIPAEVLVQDARGRRRQPSAATKIGTRPRKQAALTASRAATRTKRMA